jgi:hypothetical protein
VRAATRRVARSDYVISTSRLAPARNVRTSLRICSISAVRRPCVVWAAGSRKEASSAFLTSRAEAGAAVFKMMEVSSHKSVDTLRGYAARRSSDGGICTPSILMMHDSA